MARGDGGQKEENKEKKEEKFLHMDGSFETWILSFSECEKWKLEIEKNNFQEN